MYFMYIHWIGRNKYATLQVNESLKADKNVKRDLFETIHEGPRKRKTVEFVYLFNDFSVCCRESQSLNFEFCRSLLEFFLSFIYCSSLRSNTQYNTVQYSWLTEIWWLGNTKDGWKSRKPRDARSRSYSTQIAVKLSAGLLYCSLCNDWPRIDN